MAADVFSFTLNLPDIGMMGGVGWFLWSRYQALETRLDTMETSSIKLANRVELDRESRESDKEMLDYRIANNHNLIQHKATRIENAIYRLAGALEKVSGGKWLSAGIMQYPSDAPTGPLG